MKIEHCPIVGSTVWFVPFCNELFCSALDRCWLDFDIGCRLNERTIRDGVGEPRVLLAEVSGERVIVIFQPENLWTPEQPWEELSMFKETIGGVEIYEITPLESPGVLGLLQRHR